MSRVLHGTLVRHKANHRVAVGEILASLGDRSFGWAILLFALVNMIPAPYGSTLLTAPPLMLLTAQMALGRRYITLPDVIARRRVPLRSLRRALFRMRSLLRPIEALVRPRRLALFTARRERLLGAAFFAVACALFLPLPLSGGVPAFALLLAGLALVERDGTLMIGALVIGAVSVAITAGMVTLIATGLDKLF